jgi:hypothetical protein
MLCDGGDSVPFPFHTLASKRETDNLVRNKSVYKRDTRI